MKQPIILLSFILIFVQACKKEDKPAERMTEKIEVPEAPDNLPPVSGTTPPSQPGSTMTYRVLDAQLAYNKPVYLDANADGSADFSFYSVLIEHDDKPHLYLLVTPKTTAGSKVMVQQGPELVVYGAWISPIEKQTVIQSTPVNGCSWSEPLMKGFIVGVSKTPALEERTGLWINKKDKYIGLQFKIAGQVHYGWVRLSHDTATDVVTISDYAYNPVPGQGINAGEK